METKKTKIDEEIEKILYSDIEGKFMHIKVGDSSIISDVEKKIVDLFSKNDVNCMAFVTNKDVEIKLIERSKG